MSKCSFLMVLLLAFPVLRAAPALADVPPPNTDCTGATIAPEQYQELVSTLQAVAAGYESVFTSYAWCDELPLYIAGVPETCMPSEGWRNFWGDAEAFTLEPLYVHTLDVDGLLQYTQLDPETEALLRARSFRTGFLGAVVSTVEGEVGFYGSVRSLSDDAGAVWTYWYVQGVLSSQEVADIRSALSCAQDTCYYNPAYRSCFAEYKTCAGEASTARDEAVDNADLNFNVCAGVTLTVCVLFVVCLAGCTASGPAAPLCVVGCTGAGLAGCAAPVPLCGSNYNFAMRNANRQYNKDIADCTNEFNKCKAAVAAGTGGAGGTGGTGAGAPPVYVQE